MTMIRSSKKRSSSTRTRLNKSVLTSTIPRTAVIVITQATRTRTRIHDLQSGKGFVLDVLVVLCCQMKTVTAVKALDLLNDASINASLRLFKHNLNSHRLYYIATAVNLR
jgi:hypothetical protein